MESRSFILMVKLLMLCALLAGAAFLLAMFGNAFFPAGTPPRELVLSTYQRMLQPKPVERFVFLSLSPLAIGLALVLGRLGWTPRAPSRITNLAVCGALAGLALAGFSKFDFGPSLLGGRSLLEPYAFPSLLGLLVLAVVALAALTWRRRYPAPCRVAACAAPSIPWILFLAAMVLQICAWRLFGEGRIQRTSPWESSLDAVSYAIAQVAAGRTVLVDLPSQYGLSSEFLGDIFRLCRLSILRLSLLFAVLQVVSLTAVFHVFLRESRVRLLALLVGPALVLVSFETVLKINGIEEFYFQYWPIRFFWPALSVLGLHLYKTAPSLRRAGLVSAIAGIGCIWNLESGLPIALAFAAVLAVKWIFAVAPPQRRHLRQALGLHIVLLAAAAALAVCYLLAKGDHAPHWRWVMGYQKLFYGLGIAMLPLPLGLANPWMSVLAVYLLGLMLTAAALRRQPGTSGYDLILFLSVLGWGLFIYYQGRSHILNLISVWWPALLVAALLTDRTIRFVAAGRLGRHHLLLPALALALLLYADLAFLRATGSLWQSAEQVYRNWDVPASPLVQDELAFIRAHSRPGQSCVILAKRQGLYYAATGLVAPVEGPGYAELLTVADRDSLLRQLAGARFDCVFIGQGAESAVTLDTDILAPFRSYGLAAKNPMGSLLFLTPRP